MRKRRTFKPVKIEKEESPCELEEEEARITPKRPKNEHPAPVRRRRFRDMWMTMPEVEPWVYPLHFDPAFVWCRFCKKKIRAHLNDMRVHNMTMKHQRNMAYKHPELPDNPRPNFEHEVVINLASTSKHHQEDVLVVQGNEMASGTVAFPSVSGKEVLNPANLGFIGSGNMAQALFCAFIKKGLVDPHNIIASAPTDRNLSKLQGMGVKTTHDNNDVVKDSDVIFLCVKPHFLTEMLSDLSALEKDHNPLFVSIVTGFDIKSLEEMLSSLILEPRVIRVMPNTPCMVGQGCCMYTLGTYTSSSDSSVIHSLLSAVGMCAEIPEQQMDAACGLAGSGPAYIYSAIEALADGGVKMGLPRQIAQKMAAQMVKGAATMVLETGKHPGQLKDEVCSPGGTTITAMHTLEHNGLRNALISAVEASALRSKELGTKK